MKCGRCFNDKHESEFYKNDKTCKECRKALVRANRVSNIEYYRNYDKSRNCDESRKSKRREYQKTESGKQAKRAYQKTESGKQAHANAMQKYKERYPMKRAAHVITGNAIRDGLLQKPSICSKCDSSHKIEAHHSDYTKPLSVEWLCESCHKEWHRNNEAKYS